MPTATNCPICKRPAGIMLTDYERRARVTCPGCGTFDAILDAIARINAELLPRLSYKIRKMQSSATPPMIDFDLAERLAADPLPSIGEQADNFLLWAGNVLRETNPAAYFPLYPPDGERLLTATIGAFDSPSAWVIVQEVLVRDGLSQFRNDSGNKPEVRVTKKGWDRYEELRHSVVESRIAFMAMPFNNETLDRVFEECFKPAVAATGFELRRIIDQQKAGVIDDQMRVAIRRARFSIAELTLGNKGAYWEAGFAEGLNRPVIYTCERSYFDNEKTKPHFDINHCSTVIWKEDELDKATDELKARIRATLPDEAKITD
jgi:hypothetical protein